MTTGFPTNHLRASLWSDAVISGITGLGVAAGSGWLATWLGLPQALLATAGTILLPFAIALAWLGRRPRPLAVWGVIVLNVIWALCSIGLLVSGRVDPTVLGIAFVIAQAIVVALLAEWQFIALRKIDVPANTAS